MMPAPLEDLPLRRTRRLQLAKLVPAEAGVRAEAGEVNRIGRNVVPGEQFFLPRALIIVEANEAVRPEAHASVMQEREIFEPKLPGDFLQHKPQILGSGATAREQVGEA